MAKLSDQQQKFSKMVALLINYADLLGYGLTFGDAYRDPRVPYGAVNSFHKRRLAIDLNLFKDGVFLTDTAAHEPLGLFWEHIGGTWGGRFSRPDGNHYSFGE